MELFLRWRVFASNLSTMEGEGVLSTSQAVLQHLPSLRRYARALTGSQASGDAYVVAAVESLIASPKIRWRLMATPTPANSYCRRSST
jgi:DNA-directed RNA polymerase specialized sigma24 family protein